MKTANQFAAGRVYSLPRGGGKIVSHHSGVPSGGRTFNAPSGTSSGKNRSGQSGGGKKGGV